MRELVLRDDIAAIGGKLHPLEALLDNPAVAADAVDEPDAEIELGRVKAGARPRVPATRAPSPLFLRQVLRASR